MMTPGGSPSAPDDSATALLPGDGDLASLFDRLYLEHAMSVHSFCLSQVAERAAAEDLTHETFLRAFAAYPRVQPEPSALRTWLMAIARNLCRDQRRARVRWQRLAARVGQEEHPADSVEHVAQVRDDLRRVLAALAKLSARDRELIGLRTAAGLSYRQIAGLIGVSEETAKVAGFRALGRLRTNLGARGEIVTPPQWEAER